MIDSQYENLKFTLSELPHNYGKNVHILSNPVLLSCLAELGSEKTVQPKFDAILKKIYKIIITNVINNEFSMKNAEIDTRMKNYHKEGVYRGKIIDPEQKVVCVDLIRAGIIPTHLTFLELSQILNSKLVRQDHVIIQRMLDENEKVIGADISGSKMGGDIDDRIVLITDPMGATGSTVCEILDVYKNQIPNTQKLTFGPARKFIAVHMMITPEYLRRVTRKHPDLIVYAGRLDRGLSSDEVLRTKLGETDQERGLNDNQYIVPGAGGIGELINNTEK